MIGKRTLHSEEQFEDGETVSRFRSIFLPSHGHSGVVYRVNEYVLSSSSTHSELPTVVRIVGLFAVLQDAQYNTVVKGEIQPYIMTDDEEPNTHVYSNNYIVTPSSQSITFPTASIMRKVILCPQLPENCSFVVVDYLRPHLPICAGDVHVPYYPEKGEMVIIKGTSDETWLGHIQSVDYACKTCKVYFYVENRNNGVDVRESPHACAMDTVLWACILTAAQRQWEGREWHSNRLISLFMLFVVPCLHVSGLLRITLLIKWLHTRT